MNTSYKDLKISIPTMPVKSKTITFRVTDDLYDTINAVVDNNEITRSPLISFIIEEYLKIHNVTLGKARYFRALEKEKQEQILIKEGDLPPNFRHFTLALKGYPSAEAYSKAEMDELWETLPSED